MLIVQNMQGIGRDRVIVSDVMEMFFVTSKDLVDLHMTYYMCYIAGAKFYCFSIYP
jgi:hypothetical protein